MVQENSLNDFVIVICGPTGSGKSALASELAKQFDTEIISADSLAIYKDLDIGTAKPTLEERKAVVHHMIDVCEPTQPFSVSDYQNMARPIVKRLLDNKKIPIICGGTGFYINSLLFDFSYGNCAKNDVVRQHYEKVYHEKGAMYLHSLLEKVDPVSAEKLHFNDVKRVIRALEIYDSAGVKKSDISDSTKPIVKYYAFAYDYPREVLYDRINRRVDEMFDRGLAREVEDLKNRGLGLNDQSMQGIGYKEFFETCNDEGFIKTKELIKMNTRRYAKRQITFFKKLGNLKTLEASDLSSAVKTVRETIEK